MPAPGMIMCSYIHIICSIWCVIYNNYMFYDCGTHCSLYCVWSVKCMGISVLYLYFCVLEPTIVVIIVSVFRAKSQNNEKSNTELELFELDEQQLSLHIWDCVYSKTTSSHLSSKCIKSPSEMTGHLGSLTDHWFAWSTVLHRNTRMQKCVW